MTARSSATTAATSRWPSVLRGEPFRPSKNDYDDDPFYKFDDFGRPLDADTIARRQMLKGWKHMTVEQLREMCIRVGTLNPDGTIPEEYFGPSKYRWNE